MESRCLILDLETRPDGAGVQHVFHIGALRTDSAQSLDRKAAPNTLAAALTELDALAHGADCVVGHNIIDHDLRVLAAQAPRLALLELPVIDTLRLSPLAFPQNPYHRLLKDHKLLIASRNSPLADCRATWTLLQDQHAALAQLAAGRPGELRAIQALLADPGEPALNGFLADLAGGAAPGLDALIGLIVAALKSDPSDGAGIPQFKVCGTRLKQLLQSDLSDPALRWPIAYALAWLRVAGGNSVLAPWVRHQFPETQRLIAELRDQPCGDPGCGYCSATHDPRRQLKRFFGFDDFRAEPRGPDGESLQAGIVLAGMRGENVLAVLPTGGGKSLCYQLPALHRNGCNGGLTIVISPLQSLMKDQVDGLVAKNVLCAATLNGLLTTTERAAVLEQIEMGDVGLLFVAPEQFRSRSFKTAIRHRQIGAWIFDEAHCVSKWGHDFRPDYLYAARFIREFTGEHSVAPIGCFTATAKLEVLADIRDHFKRELGVEFKDFLAEPKRDNLQFEVMPTPQGEKWARCHALLKHDLQGSAGGAIVFVARRKSADELAEFLKRQDWLCEPFHAGLTPQIKKDRQDAFIKGDLKVIVATNAFGMGVDKPDVRLVVHAEIPGSLENYLQEAGRAGRDQQAARCVLLYDPDDIETQFGISERSKLSEKDIRQILKKLRFVASRRGNAPVVITAGEILADEDVETSFAVEARDADTKVATAVAWLERAQLLQRNENRTNIYPAKLQFKTLEEAGQRIDGADLAPRRKAQYLAVLGVLYGARADERISTDDLMLATSLELEEVEQILKGLEHLKLLENDTRITLYLHAGVIGASASRFDQSVRLETSLIETLRELAPDADQGGGQTLALRALTTALRERFDPKPVVIEVQRLLRALSQDRDGPAQARSHFELKEQGHDAMALRIRGGTWGDLAQSAERRRTIADKLLRFLLAKLAPGQKGKDLLIETTIGELVGVVDSDIELSAQVRPEHRQAMVQRVLLYLHREEVLVLNHGMTVLRRAMTIKVNREEKRRYVRADFEPLADHYKEKRIQVHVMREYAEVAVRQLAAAIRLVGDYFSLPERDFLRRYFADKKEVLDLATSEASWRRIVDGLNPVQREIVEDKSDSNRLVLAGPGAGKTRVIVHRVAWLLRVQRVPAAGIIVLAFNRHAAAEVRVRLRELVGNDAIGLTVLTYHAMAMRLVGVSFSGREDVGESELKKVIDDAAALLEGGGSAAGAGSEPGEADDLRLRLLQGYRYILVDEYQDIDASQYRLVSALAGRRADPDDKLTLLAVGDDDQNVYAFRHTSNRFIEQFRSDWGAQVSFLVDNYRSSALIVDAANAVIAGNRERLKREHPIHIDPARAADPPGGRWEALDAQRRGRLLRLRLPAGDRGEGNLQCQAVMNEIARLIELDAGGGWPDAAVLARTHAELQPFVAWCRRHGVPYQLAADKENRLPTTRERDFVRAVDALRAAPEHEQRADQALALIRALPLAPAWLLHFESAADQLVAEFGDLTLSRQMLIDWLYDHAREQRRVGGQGAFLGTVHSAKGLEFKHVSVLGNWRENGDDERRLFYVAMTRAKETLTLCEFDGPAHPFAPGAFASGFGQTQRVDLPHDPALATRFRMLNEGDLDLGFAGRQPAWRPVHAAAELLREGEALGMKPTGEGRIEFCNGAGIVVARTTRNFDAGFAPERAEIAAVLVRHATQGDPKYHASNKVERWLLPVPLLIGRSDAQKAPNS